MATQTQVKNQVQDTRVTTVYDFLEKKRSLIESSLPKTITPERLIGTFTMILRNSPALGKCTQTSLISAVIQTVQLGLQPGNIGHVYLVPFKNKGVNEVQLIVGYRGLCELVNRSGRAVVLTAEVVKKNDVFEYEMGLEPKLRHIPAEGERGAIIGVYAIAKNLNANEKVFVYLQDDEIEKVKNTSKSKNSDYSPWKTWPEEMAKKTAVKRLCKLLPLSSDIQKQIGADETVKNTISADIPSEKNEADWNGEEVEDADFKQEDPATPEKAPSEYEENPDGSIKE